MVEIVDIETRREAPRDGRGRPLIVPKAGGKAVAHTRTTTFIDVLEDKTNLQKWSNRGILIAAMKFPELAQEALRLDPEDPDDKRRLNDLAEQLFAMGGFNAKRDKGTELHTLSELVDQGIPLPVRLPEVDFNDMAAYMMATTALTVKKIEQMVVINELPTAGTPDRVSLYDGPGPFGDPFCGHVIDITYGALKIAAQLATYGRGEVYDHTVFPDVDATDKKALAKWKKIEHDPELAASAYSPLPEDISRDWGIVINLRPGSAEATLHWVDLEIGWEAAQAAKVIRALRSKKGKALTPFA